MKKLKEQFKIFLQNAKQIQQPNKQNYRFIMASHETAKKKCDLSALMVLFDLWTGSS